MEGALAPFGAICRQIRAYPLCGGHPRNAPALPGIMPLDMA